MAFGAHATPRRRSAITLAILLTVLIARAPAQATTFPSGFQESTILLNLTYPTAVQFASDGRIFIAEKSGLIKVFDGPGDTTPTIFADLRTNTHNFWDRGLLGMVLHPSFPTMPYVYVLYTLDAAIGGTPPRWGSFAGTSDGCPGPPGDTTDGCVVAGRVSRLTAAGSVMTGTEEVFVENWCQQFPSHSIGTIAFGPDGALYVSGGDGASFTFADYGQRGYPLVNPCDDPPGVGVTPTQPSSEGGALRSQDVRTSADPQTYDGTVLRLNPVDGTPMPDNPLVGNAVASDDPVIAYGLRNPFRMTPRPGTNEIWIGDVGWNDWEEIDRIGHTGDILVENFGWPCYEGIARQPLYEGGSALCSSLYAAPGTATDPVFQYKHADKVVPGESCSTGSSSITGLAFYGTGSYPSAYDGALFFADYSRNCIWAAPLGPDGEPDLGQRLTFAEGAHMPVDIAIGPGGDLYYVDVSLGRLMRISYVAASQPPLAVIDVDQTDGPTPLTVQFDGSGSSDPDPGDTLAYSWDLDGNGTFGDSTLVAPARTYTDPGTTSVKLRVTDPHGASAVASVDVTAGNTRPTAQIATPTGATTWHAGSLIAFSGSATDPEQGALGADALTWTLVLHHCPSNCHEHTVQTFDGVSSGSFNAPEHDYPTHLELRLTATDAGGLTDTTSVLLYPETVDLTIATDPPGLTIAAGTTSATTPYVRTEIVGSTVTVVAPSPQTLGDVTYAFVSWSDGGARSHDVAAPATATSYVALFEPTSPTATATTTPVATATPTASVTPTATATPVATATPTASVTPTATATVTPTASVTATPEETASSTPTATPSLTATPTPTATMTTTASATPIATTTTTSTPEPTATATAIPTTTATSTPIPTITATPAGGTGSCATAMVIPAAGGTFTGTTSGTGTLAGTCASSAASPEQVYQWTPATSGNATIQTCSGADTSYDTVVYVRHASCASGVEVACNDDAVGCFTSEPNDHHASRLTAAVTAGETYFIVVDGYGGRSGSFMLSVSDPVSVSIPTPTASPTMRPVRTATATPVPTPGPTPLDGTCAEPITLPAAGGSFSDTTTDGASQLGGSCGTSGNSPERVFTWTPATSGTAQLSTCGTSATSYDTILYVRNATCGGAELACNDDTPGCGTAGSAHHGSRLALSVTAGQTYVIVVDGYNGRNGTFTLSLVPPP